MDNPSPTESHSGNLSDLLRDVMLMAEFAMESGSLPDDIRMDELYRMWEIKIVRGQELPSEDINLIQDYFQQLQEQLTPITAASLKATEFDGIDKKNRNMSTPAARHVWHLWIATFIALTTILAINLYQYMFEFNAADWAKSDPDFFATATLFYTMAVRITPFAYGAFGAAVYLLRLSETSLRNRTFDPRTIPEYRNRFVLGTISGGVIVMFYSTGGTSETDVKLTEAALGFLAGYSIDLLFSILDRIVGALMPSEPTAVSLGKRMKPGGRSSRQSGTFEKQKLKDESPHIKAVSSKD